MTGLSLKILSILWVILYFLNHKKNWIKRLPVLCAFLIVSLILICGIQLLIGHEIIIDTESVLQVLTLGFMIDNAVYISEWKKQYKKKQEREKDK